MTAASSPGLTADEAHRSGYRWVMLGGMWLGYACFGLIFASAAPLIEPMREDFGLSLTSMGTVLGIWPLIYVIVSLPAGSFTDRVGLRWSLTIGILTMALSAAARALAFDYWSLLGAVALFGLGGPLVSIGAPKLVSTWFSERDRASAIGLYTTGPQLGSVFALASTNSIFMPLTGDDWRLTILIFAGFALLCGLIWALVARIPATSEDSAESTAASETHTLRASLALLGFGSVQIVLLLGFGGNMFTHGAVNWLPEILRESGKSAAEAGFLAAVPTIVGILSSLIILRFATPGRWLMLMLGTCVAGIAGPLLISTEFDPFVIAGLMGVGVRSTFIPLTLLLLMSAAPVRSGNMGIATGLYFSVAQIGGVTGPLLVGAIADQSGSFTTSLVALAFINVLLLPVIFVARRPQPRLVQPS